MTAEDRDAAVDPQRLDTIKARMRNAFVDDDGNPPPEEQLAAVVEEKAAQYEDAPIQDFTTLLTEHDARDALREQGLHARLEALPPDADIDAAEPAVDDGEEGAAADAASTGVAARIAPLGTPSGPAVAPSSTIADHEVEAS